MRGGSSPPAPTIYEEKRVRISTFLMFLWVTMLALSVYRSDWHGVNDSLMWLFAILLMSRIEDLENR